MRLLLAVLLAAPLSAYAKGIRFDYRDGGLRNVIQFVSDAWLERTVGISNGLGGWIELDPDSLTDGVRGEIEFDVRTFQTGVEARNEIIRDKFLLAAENPIAVLALNKLTSASKAKLADGQVVVMRLDGSLKVRNVTKPQTVLIKAVYLKESEQTRQRLPGNLLKVSATFDVDLLNYNASVPDGLKSRVARFIQLTLDAIGSDRPPVAAPPPSLARPD